MSDTKQEAIALAKAVYEAFMREVVERHVLTDRVGALSAQKQKKIETERDIDVRPVRLMTISGKGGWSADPSLRERYAESTNVTLLDHLLSVVRGAVTFAALDTLAANSELDQDALRSELRVVAAIAFMHDLDKDLGLTRDAALPLEPLAERWSAYGLDDFVEPEYALEPDQIRALIEHAETSQVHRSPAATAPPRALRHLMRYIALADKLDGLWLKEGIDAVLKRLEQDAALSTGFLKSWAKIDLFDPHHPFLVDELQRYLSAQCERLTQVPPLIEVHQDGRLVMLIPAEQADEIKQAGIKRLGKKLTRELFHLRVNVSVRAVPELLDAQPDHEGLLEYTGTVPLDREFGRLFLVKASLADEFHTARLDELLGGLGLSPAWPKAAGQTLTPFPSPGELPETAQLHLRRTAHLLALLNHKQVRELPEYESREQQLLEAVGVERPEWIAALADRISRQVFTGFWAVAIASEDAEVFERVWGDDGLLRRWLEGAEGEPGLRDSIDSKGAPIVEAVVAHFAAALTSRAVHSGGAGNKRCLFTDQPLTPRATFTPADKLYEIKKSAFSGRDGRLEDVDSAQGEAQVSPVSYAEHRFRSHVHAAAGGKPDGIPTLLSSPSTTGLFAALALASEADFGNLSVYDLAREQVSKGRVYRGFDAYRHRYRVARFERMPERTEDQVDQLRLLLRAALRFGRPVHLFRGLPTQERAFFAFDAMPRRLADLIGGSQLRLEQIPSALERLETANLILSTNGLGFEVFDRYARPATRLGAVCLAWAQLHDDAKDGQSDRSGRFWREFEQLMEEPLMSDTEAPLVELGRAAARIQRYPGAMASANLELLTFSLSLETAIAAWKLNQRDAESLAMAVAGELETNLVRRQQQSAKTTRSEVSLTNECIAFARRFVNDVWFGVLDGRPPAQANRRVLASIYRMSFLTAPRTKSDAEPEITTESETTTENAD
ncbi:hypothetical protein [Halochromatium glycolicum]|uniref:Uncharacterized protein n=1 Tax=Halochromatium glycolicum TaxID=85075 RepID=A0AAJ0U258_9GAMM|nr:hypothetical protein [Halochromatium glycolicum]MBK1703901.1 hypothetical protein [Halochromatium glycolicum]